MRNIVNCVYEDSWGMDKNIKLQDLNKLVTDHYCG